MSAAERRDAAIEAGARVLAGGDGPFDVLNGPEQFVLRDVAEKVIDAALPHLVGEPIGYDFVGRSGVYDTVEEATEARAQFLEAVNGDPREWPVVALVPTGNQS